MGSLNFLIIKWEELIIMWGFVSTKIKTVIKMVKRQIRGREVAVAS